MRRVSKRRRTWRVKLTVAVSSLLVSLVVCDVVLRSFPAARPFPGYYVGERENGPAGDSIVPVRWVLGTVPVEEDGSAHFIVPAEKELYFQALDEKIL